MANSTATTKLIINKNFLGTNQAEILIHKLPAVCFFAQKCNLPGLKLPGPDMPTPLISIPQPGDQMMFDQLAVTFLVDEDMENWLSVYQWITGIGFPNDPTTQSAPLYNMPPWSPDGIFSDITQVILDSKGRPNLQVVYQGCMPDSLSEVVFDTTRSTVDYATSTVTFRYTSYSIMPIGRVLS